MGKKNKPDKKSEDGPEMETANNESANKAKNAAEAEQAEEAVSEAVDDGEVLELPEAPQAETKTAGQQNEETIIEVLEAEVVVETKPEQAEPDEEEEEGKEEPPQYTYHWDLARRPAQDFKKPRYFATSAELLRVPATIPVIHVSLFAAMKMYLMLSYIEQEIGWLGTAYRHNEKDFRIADVFIFHQDISAGHSELSKTSMADFICEMMGTPDGEEIFNNTKFWGHSHGSGGTFPSGQDDTQAESFAQGGEDFFIRGIFNRQGDMNFSVYDWEKGIAFHRIPWLIQAAPADMPADTYDRLKEFILQEMKTKVVHRRKVYKHKRGRISKRGKSWIERTFDTWLGG
ncbi:hypothetical protein IPM19_03450 [bacterium]|nr:MAG: hypothetical protein IPM19_03450 [bacterium]